MTFPAYPDYRDSGVEWLGAVPTYWESWKISHAFGELGSGTTPPTTEAEWYENGTVPWVTTGELRESVIWETKKLLSPTALSAFSALRLHPAGSLAIAMYGATIGILGVDATTNQACCLLTRPNQLHVKFTFYWLLVFKQSIIDLYASGGGQPNINQEIIANLKIPAPRVPEQTQIARFLDHETARIDALIEEQQRLIELLKEKRQAVISHAVTKGLDPTVPMKDSGVEWLGEVPAHWVISQLKFNTLEMQTGPFGSQLHAEDYVDGGIPLVNPAHMIDGKIIPDTQVTVDEVTWQRLKRHALTAGDIIFARRGELGRCAIVTNEQDGWLCGTGSLKAKLNAQLDAEYAYLLITSKGAVAELSLESKGSTMENLNTETLGRIRLPLPPVSEQKAILEYVHEVSGQFAALVDAAESGISLITERRSALISAAVTGKIDVRGWQPPNAARHTLEETEGMPA
jgi:type I restriction enzyme S subunit